MYSRFPSDTEKSFVPSALFAYAIWKYGVFPFAPGVPGTPCAPSAPLISDHVYFVGSVLSASTKSTYIPMYLFGVLLICAAVGFCTGAYWICRYVVFPSVPTPGIPCGPAYCFASENCFDTTRLFRYAALMFTHPLSAVKPVTVYVLVSLSQFPCMFWDVVIVYVQLSVISCVPYMTVAVVVHSGNSV